jgi:RecB family exonuclease
VEYFHSRARCIQYMTGKGSSYKPIPMSVAPKYTPKPSLMLFRIAFLTLPNDIQEPSLNAWS